MQDHNLFIEYIFIFYSLYNCRNEEKQSDTKKNKQMYDNNL